MNKKEGIYLNAMFVKKLAGIFKIIAIIVVIIILIGIGTVRYVLVPEKMTNKKNTDMCFNSFDDLILAAAETNANQQTHKWAILVHSYRTDHRFMNPYAKAYQEQGYNTLQPDNRAHGQSEGDYIGMGYLDQYDILSWIDYIIEKDPEAEIVLHGVSMGASTLMMLSGQADIPDNVKVMIEDCGYTSAKDYLTWKLNQRFHLPAFPVIPIANVAFKVSAGYYMNDASALEGVKKSDIPTLFIHGTEDRTVPVEDVYKLYEAATCEKQLYIVEGAGHGEALWKNEIEYWKQVFDFINRL